MRRLFIAAVIISCAIHHNVRLLLGPNESTISSGFLCMDPLDTSQLLFARAYTASTGTLDFRLVVDLIDLGGAFPSCLAEDIRATCLDESGPCKLLQSIAPTRICEQVSMPFDLSTNAAVQVNNYLHAHYTGLIANATDRPVIVRAVATLESCNDVRQPSSTHPDSWAHLDSDDPSSPTAKNVVLGCAYSCPVLLDEVDDSVSLGIDLGFGVGIPNDACIATIDACAKFPAPSK